MKTFKTRVFIPEAKGNVDAILQKPSDAKWLLVMAHGAGARMNHPFMQKLSALSAENGIATLRYQFWYTQQGLRRPDPKPLLLATIRAAVEKANEFSGGLPLIAGGKSMGGRMTSTAHAQSSLPNVRGIVFFGFPLHRPGSPSTERAEHLNDVKIPMLFLQGTRDPLADLNLLRPVCKTLGKKATLHVIDGADHSFHVLKRSGRGDADVMIELAHTVNLWASNIPQ